MSANTAESKRKSVSQATIAPVNKELSGEETKIKYGDGHTKGENVPICQGYGVISQDDRGTFRIRDSPIRREWLTTNDVRDIRLATCPGPLHDRVRRER